MTGIEWACPQAWQTGVPLGLLLLLLSGWSHWRQGVKPWRMAMLLSLRGLALATLVLLLARPTLVTREKPVTANRNVMLLMDRSESMGLEEGDSTRYRQATAFLRERLLPALREANLPVQAFLFAEDAQLADGRQLAAAKPTGRRTNLGGAIAHALASQAQPPLAVIALTDGLANESADNARALSALMEAHAPFIGVGFGSDQGATTLQLRHVDAPPTVAVKTAFTLSAQLEGVNLGETPAFDLLLLRDGQLLQKRSIQAGKGSRIWMEQFRVSEDEAGLHHYTVQMMPPGTPGLKCPAATQSAIVQVREEKEVRVLYIQGALTWDYKYINLALRNDPAIKLTGLTRTSKQSVFRQNVESASELIHGFPTTIEELSPFRVIVLSSLRASDLTPAQQDILVRFCGELGGGLLMIGGAGTFDGSWQNSRLERVMPVVFARHADAPITIERAFRLDLTEEALQHPVFQISDGGKNREIWSQLPAFNEYARVDAAKPGARVWALHQSDQGPNGRRILMAAQRYGAGSSAVLCLQNFWRWRLARDAEPANYDRFWRQFFRFLSDAGRQEVTVYLADQELRPQMDVQVVLERQPNPKILTEPKTKYLVRVEDGQKKLLREETVELETGRPHELKFRAEKPGAYSVAVLDSQKNPLCSRTVEIRDVNVELQNTARNMETLRQWASVSGGLAVKVEDCSKAGDLARDIRDKIESTHRIHETRRPVGINAWMLTLVLFGLGGEWLLRKQWGMI